MVDTISKRRTHYEILGLTPAATSDEIERAFAGAISIFQPHGFGSVAEAAVAFRTLRDPVRRRAYDASLAIKPEPTPRRSPMRWDVGARFMSATATPVMRLAIDRLAPPEPQVEERPRLQELPRLAESEPQPEPFIAAKLREIASPEPLRETIRAKLAANTVPQTLETVREETRQRRVSDGDRRVDLALSPADAVEDGISWKRAGILVGAITVAVALLGAWAGWSSVSDAEPVQNAAKVVLPPPTTYTVGDPVAGAPNRALDDARPLSRKKPAQTATRVVRARPTPGLAGLERQLSQPDATPVEASAGTTVSAEAPVAVAASLPLPNRVIARTIERIGYPCGQVASTAQSGAPGVFTVTCTSGHSYQAAPVRGRYHFRRLGG